MRPRLSPAERELIKKSISAEKGQSRSEVGPFVRIYLEITTQCNMTCGHCTYNHSAKKQGYDMPFEFFTKIIDHLKKVANGHPIRVTLGSGEPFLHPDIIKMHCIEVDVCVTLVTNGSLRQPFFELLDQKIAKYGGNYGTVFDHRFGIVRSKDEWHDASLQDSEITDFFDKHYPHNYWINSLVDSGRGKSIGGGRTDICVCGCAWIDINGMYRQCGCNGSPIIANYENTNLDTLDLRNFKCFNGLYSWEVDQICTKQRKLAAKHINAGAKHIVAYATDANQYLPALVSIKSLITHADIDTEVYLFAHGVDDDRLQLTSMLQTDLVKTIPINISDQFTEFYNSIHNEKMSWRDGPDNCGYYPFTAFFRYALPSVFPFAQRALYLDCDTMVRSSLKELFGLNLNGTLLAASTLPLVSDERYFNSGVMMMNLQLMRQTKFEERFWDSVIKHGTTADEHTLNPILQPLNNLIVLEDKWNYKVWCEGPPIFVPLDRAKASDANIVHFGGVYWKPWKGANVVLADEWWNHARAIGYEALTEKYGVPILYGKYGGDR